MNAFSTLIAFAFDPSRPNTAKILNMKVKTLLGTSNKCDYEDLFNE